MKLIIGWTYLLLHLYAHSAELKEISDEQIKSTFISQLKDTQIENQLSETAQFKNCVKENQFDPKDDQTKRNEKLKKATECFKKELAGADATALQKISDNLQLQSYGLVKSKNVNDITDYFSKKLSKALTGRDPDDKNPDRLLWENQKIVDQEIYLDLYKAQLAKAAIFEISRFCFEHLRKNGSSSIKNFEEHWKKDSTGNLTSIFPMKPDPNNPQNTIPNIDLLSDNGEPSFFDMGTVPTNDLSKQEVVYQKLKTGLTSNTQINLDVYKNFITYCMQSIPLLCNHFKQSVQNKTKVNGDENSVALEGINSKTKQYSGSLSKGSSACLTMDHLSNIRTTLSKTDLVKKQFEEMGDTKTIVEMMKKPKFYERGKGAGEESLDDITNVASGEILGNTDYKNVEDLEKKCVDNPEDTECKDFLSKGQSLDLAITNVETNLNLKRELEVERVKKIKKDIQELEAYLTDKGHLDLLDKLKKKELTADQIETEIAKIYDARKVAEIEALKLRVGSRQIRDDAQVDDSDKERIVKENITKSKEEKARMAQVMLFNNIISTQLQMQKKDDTGKTIGDPIANTRGWAKEAKELENKGIQSDFFQGVQDFVKENSSEQDSGEIQGVEVIDIILGAKEKSN